MWSKLVVYCCRRSRCSNARKKRKRERLYGGKGDVVEVGKCEGLKRKFRIIADATVVRSLDKGREESSMCKEENCKTSVESSSKYCIGSWKG